jgi:hypothetical protein
MRDATRPSPSHTGGTKRMIRILAVPALLLQVGCEALPQTVQVDGSLIEAEAAPRPTVCDPFGSGNPAAGSNYGLIANLWYVPPGARTYDNVADYQANGTRLDATLYFNQLNVPTRAFDRGFQTQNGTILTTPAGDTLYEYFSLRFESEIRLTDHDQPGRYQFAVLADDGAVLYVNDDGMGYRALVDNDGTHPTRLGCATEGIDMDYETFLPIALDYYQGPRYHIALMVLWRKLPDGNQSYNDVACGLEGNERFFDSNFSPSVPKQTWLDMLQRGWRVVAPQNYMLPLTAPENPCDVDPNPS